MSIMPIIKVPNDVLTAKCEPITQFDEDTKLLVENMLETVRAARNPEGAGLAAPQVGVLKRILIARRFGVQHGDTGDSAVKDYALINPVITKCSQEKSVGWEACFSIPNTYTQVERFEKIKVEAYDVDGKKFLLNATGFFARVIQHEIDHLDGILMTDSTRSIGKPLSEEEFDKINSDE